MTAQTHSSVPKPVLLGAGAMLVLSIGIAAAARQSQLAAPVVPTAPPLEVLEARFEDRPDGAISVVEASTGREVSLLPPQSNGFIRGVLRGMFRTRKLESKPREPAFRITREADGRLLLVDPETGRRVDLDSFGPSNSASFAQLLAAAKTPGAAQ